MNKTVLIDIDTQNDFILSSGKLSITGAKEIVPNIMSVFDTCVNKGVRIISTIDVHTIDDPEFKTYPEHCIVNSGGVQKINGTIAYGDRYVDKDRSIPMDRCMQTIIRKSTYNVWDKDLGNPELMAEILNYLKPEKIIVIGVALDICVKAFAKGLHVWMNMVDCEFVTPKLYLVTNATKGLSNPDDTLIELSGLGFTLCDSDYVKTLV